MARTSDRLEVAAFLPGTVTLETEQSVALALVT